MRTCPRRDRGDVVGLGGRHEGVADGSGPEEPDGGRGELTRLAVQNKTGQFSRLILDIAGSRDARQAELAQLVDRAIAKLEEGAAEASLPPMSSYERKLVHDIVSERGYVSTSHGEGRERYTVITAA